MGRTDERLLPISLSAHVHGESSPLFPLQQKKSFNRKLQQPRLSYLSLQRGPMIAERLSKITTDRNRIDWSTSPYSTPVFFRAEPPRLRHCHASPDPQSYVKSKKSEYGRRWRSRVRVTAFWTVGGVPKTPRPRRPLAPDVDLNRRLRVPSREDNAVVIALMSETGELKNGVRLWGFHGEWGTGMISVAGADAWGVEIEESGIVFEGLGSWRLHGENR